MSRYVFSFISSYMGETDYSVIDKETGENHRIHFRHFFGDYERSITNPLSLAEKEIVINWIVVRDIRLFKHEFFAAFIAYRREETAKNFESLYVRYPTQAEEFKKCENVAYEILDNIKGLAIYTNIGFQFMEREKK